MDEQYLRLACLRMVLSDLPSTSSLTVDKGYVIAEAERLYDYIKNGTGAPKRRARTQKADKA